VGLKVGTRLRSQNSTCEVIIIKGTEADDALKCAGVEMAETAAASDAVLVTEGTPVELGKRYSDDADTVEVLCTKAGLGPLTLGEVELTQKAAKTLPASD
jgi:predicted GTPase